MYYPLRGLIIFRSLFYQSAALAHSVRYAKGMYAKGSIYPSLTDYARIALICVLREFA